MRAPTTARRASLRREWARCARSAGLLGCVLACSSRLLAAGKATGALRIVSDAAPLLGRPTLPRLITLDPMRSLGSWKRRFSARRLHGYDCAIKSSTAAKMRAPQPTLRSAWLHPPTWCLALHARHGLLPPTLSFFFPPPPPSGGQRELCDPPVRLDRRPSHLPLFLEARIVLPKVRENWASVATSAGGGKAGRAALRLCSRPRCPSFCNDRCDCPGVHILHCDMLMPVLPSSRTPQHQAGQRALCV